MKMSINTLPRKFVSMSDVMVQTRLPGEVAKWLKARADRDGDSVAGALRRLAVAESTKAIVHAWLKPEAEADSVAVMGRGEIPHFHLQVVEHLPFGEILARLYTTDGHRVPGDFWRSTGYFAQLDQHRFLLKGDHRAWKIISSFENSQLKVVELRLKPFEQRALAVVKMRDLPGGAGIVAVVYGDGMILAGKVGRQHNAYHSPEPGSNFYRAGWLLPPEMVLEAMLRGVPGSDLDEQGR
jgi:hypothetical protein